MKYQQLMKRNKNFLHMSLEKYIYIGIGKEMWTICIYIYIEY